MTNLKRITQGFTLIELMVTVALFSAILGIAVPSFTHLVNNNRTQTLTQEVIALLNFARSTAVTQRTTVAVCPNQSEWLVKKGDCTSSKVLRTMAVPDKASLATSSTAFIYSYNGTTAATSIIACAKNDPLTGFTIDIRSTGSTRTYARGMTSSGQMSSCS